MKIKSIMASMLAMATLMSVMTACGSKTEDDNKKSKDTKEISIYMDDTGAYYLNDNNDKVYLQTTDGSSEDVPVDEGTDDYSFDPIYGSYDANGIKFDIPDGWYADDSFGTPVIYSDNTDQAYDSIMIAPGNYFVDADYADIDKAYMEELFDGYVEQGSCVGYEITEINDLAQPDDGTAVKGFVVKIENTAYSFEDESSDESEEPETETFYTEYLFVDAEQTYAIVLNAENTDESIARIDELRDAVLPTLSINVEPVEETTENANEVTVEPVTEDETE